MNRQSKHNSIPHAPTTASAHGNPEARLSGRLLTVAAAAMILSGGCTTPETAQSSLPAFGVLDRADLSSSQKKLLARAETDFNRILESKNPRYSIPVLYFTDGGSIIYYGNGYELTSLRRMTKQNGKDGYIVGPSIKLDGKITGGEPVYHSQTSFVLKDDLPPRR